MKSVAIFLIAFDRVVNPNGHLGFVVGEYVPRNLTEFSLPRPLAEAVIDLADEASGRYRRG